MNIENLRQEFEAIPEINEVISGLSFFEDRNLYGFYGPEKNQIHCSWINGAWWQFQQMNRKLEGCVVVPEWISTNDYLPEEGVEVLVHRYGQVIQATKDSEYSGGFKERNCYGWQATYGVTHWMPKNFKLPDHCSYYYNDEHPYKETMVEAARGGNEKI